MLFSTDRDLLAYEPAVFNDVPLLTQQHLHAADGEVDGTLVTSVTADFDAAGTAAGDVLLIDKVPHEVIERLDAATLRVSKLRTRMTDPLIGPGDGVGRELIVRTFAPQAQLVHQTLLRLLGLGDDRDHDLTADAVVSLTTMARLETLGTLERIYSAAVAIGGDNADLHAKADRYARQFAAACAGAGVLIDTNGDGLPDERRFLGLCTMRRA
jgi:hypothetical protein